MTLSEYAKTWVGKHFAGYAIEQCMLFVRHCMHETSNPLRNKVTEFAIDGLATSYAIASSVFGKDCGTIVTDIKQVKENDLVAFKNTYGEWGEGTITHVGIALGGGNFIHRPTASRPVEMTHLVGYWESHWRCALRWTEVEKEVGRKLKWFLHDGISKEYIDGKENSSPFVLSNYDNSLNLNNKARKLLWAKLELGFED